MYKMSDQQQSAFTAAVQQMQQSQLVQQQQQQQKEVHENEIMQQSQQVQVTIEQPRGRMDMQMLSDASTEGTAQRLRSLDPTSTFDTFGPVPNRPTVWPSQQQQDHAQMGKHANGWNPEQFVQQASSQIMQYNDQIFLPRRMFSRSTPAAIQVMSQEQALSFPTRNAALPTATNQSLVIDQLDIMSNWPNIEHNEMQQKCGSCVTEKPVQQNAEVAQYSPLQQYNASFPRGFAWATPQFPPLLDCVPNRPNLLRSIRPRQDNQQQAPPTPGYTQQHPQQHYGQTVVQTSEGVLQTVEKMDGGDVAAAAANSVVKSRYVDIQPDTVTISTGMGNNRQAVVVVGGGVSGQHDEQQQQQQQQQSGAAVRDRSVVLSVVACSSQTSTAQLPFSPQSQPSVSMPLVILKPDESFGTSIVQIQKTLTAEATKSVLSDEDIAKDKTLLKAVIKPQMYTQVIEGIVVQESCRPFAETSLSDSPGVYNIVQGGENVTSDEPTRKKIKLDANGQGNVQMKNEYKCVSTQKRLEISENNSRTERVDQIDEDSWDCELVRCSVSNANSSDVWFNQVQKQKVQVVLPSELASKKLMTWTVEDVQKVIVSVADCDEIAAKFEYHEIDGHALTLLELVHLVRYMGIKLGPALKLISTLNAMRAKFQEPPQSQPCAHVYKYKSTQF